MEKSGSQWQEAIGLTAKEDREQKVNNGQRRWKLMFKPRQWEKKINILGSIFEACAASEPGAQRSQLQDWVATDVSSAICTLNGLYQVTQPQASPYGCVYICRRKNNIQGEKSFCCFYLFVFSQTFSNNRRCP